MEPISKELFDQGRYRAPNFIGLPPQTGQAAENESESGLKPTTTLPAGLSQRPPSPALPPSLSPGGGPGSADVVPSSAASSSPEADWEKDFVRRASQFVQAFRQDGIYDLRTFCNDLGSDRPNKIKGIMCSTPYPQSLTC